MAAFAWLINPFGWAVGGAAAAAAASFLLVSSSVSWLSFRKAAVLAVSSKEERENVRISHLSDRIRMFVKH